MWANEVPFTISYKKQRLSKPQVANEESSTDDVVIGRMEPEEEWSSFFKGVKCGSTWPPEVDLSEDLTVEKCKPLCVGETNKVFDGNSQ
jgi:hypothetical protein